jgi:hypothetical protein
MNPRTRIDDFQGTDSEYIIYLESKVNQLTGILVQPYSPLSLSLDAGNKTSNPNLKFVLYNPNIFIQLAKRQRITKPR